MPKENSKPPSELPRERCLSQGPECLSLRECLAVLLGTGPSGQGALGVAEAILDRSGKGLSEQDLEQSVFIALETSGRAHLHGIRGLGSANQARILAAFELGRRYALFRERNRRQRAPKPKLATLSEKALSQITLKMRDDPKEWLGFVPFHRSGRLGEVAVVERGVRTHVNTDPAELFARILALRPQGFFLFHNHPSGDPSPSPQDFELTERVRRVAEQLTVPLLGHWIVGSSAQRWLPPEIGRDYFRGAML